MANIQETSEKLLELQRTKTRFKTAFANKDIDVSNTPFTQYPEKMAEIKTKPNLQEKIATQNGEVVADEGFDGLSKVNVDVPQPSGTIEITANGIQNVKDYENANINVPVPDLSQTTATESDVREGKEFFNASGEKVVGTYENPAIKFFGYADHGTLELTADDLRGIGNPKGYAFHEDDRIKKVTIPNTMTRLSMRMFNYCSYLEEVVFEQPAKVENIYEYAFHYCVKLKNITIPQKVKLIGQYSFQYCENLESVVFEENSLVEKISDQAFARCGKLNNFIMPPNINEIGNQTFRYCTFPSITITNAIQKIGGYAFADNTGLTTLTFEKGTMMTKLYETILYGCTNLTNLTLRNLTTSIQIGSGTKYGTLLTDESIVNTFQELHDLTGKTAQTLTLSTPSNARTEAIYVKLIDVTDEMRADDEYIDSKKPCVVCESTDEGAMTLKAYGISKNWQIKE